MIDIHSHILPGLDDGANSLTESVSMCEIAYNDGITDIVASPHDLNGVYNNDREIILKQCKILNDKLREMNIHVNILPGADIAMNMELLNRLQNNSLMTINDTGAFILLEPPDYFQVMHLKRMVFDLKVKGITSIITHPERNKLFQSNIEYIYELIDAGALIQVTAGSITGKFGNKVREFCIQMISRQFVHVMASDAHNTKTRAPGLSEAREAVEKLTTKEDAMKMVSEIPHKIINGILPDISKPLRPTKKRSWFSFLSK